MASIVCLDTNILVWGLRRNATSGQEANIHKASYLLECLTSEKGLKVVIPSIVLAESLAGIPSQQKIPFAIRVQEVFPIAPFDAQAAAEFARIVSSFSKGKGRTILKADAMILAIALAQRADEFYTEDEEILKRGSRFIEVKRMPVPPPRQLKLIPSSD